MERNINVIKDADGNSIVMINDIRFRGKRSVNWDEKAKANASQGMPELIEIAVGRHFRKNVEEKHSRNAKFGWYRYDSRFALPVYGSDGEVERYNVFMHRY